MTWFKVDDKLHSHPKTTGASLAALGLWTVAGSWCGDHTTDGRVPLHMVPLLSRGAVELADELVDVGLWVRVKDGYKFHDWLAYQPSSKDVAKLREARAAAGRKGGINKAKRASKTASKSLANARAPASLANKQTPTPTRPDPPPTGGRGVGGSAAPSAPDGAQPHPPENHATTDHDPAVPTVAEPSSLRCRTCGNTMSSAYHRNSCLRTQAIGGVS